MKLDDFLSKSCGCNLGPHHVACSSIVYKVAIVQTSNNCLKMSRNEVDVVIMAQINALMTQATDQLPLHHRQGGFRPHMRYFLHGMQPCQKVILFLRAVSTKQSRTFVLLEANMVHHVHNRMHGNMVMVILYTVWPETLAGRYFGGLLKL